MQTEALPFYLPRIQQIALASQKTGSNARTPLVTNTKSSTPPLLRPATGLPVLDSLALLQPKAKDSQVAFKERYALQDVARTILGFEHRIGKCLRVRIKGDCVPLMKDAQGRAYYGNLARCGSVWGCPVCSAGIAEKRRLLLTSLAAKHKDTGGKLYLLTRTVPHGISDRLPDLMKSMALAEVKYKAGAPYKRIVDEYGIVGTARGFEATFGVNGWHPHIHEIVFLKRELTVEQEIALKDAFYKRWKSACTRAGLKEPSKDHGVHLQDGTRAAGYIAKWGLESELTKSHIKETKEVTSLTPFDLLRLVDSPDVPDIAKKQARALFTTFATAFHGKRQLVISPGLLALYDEEMESDEEAVEVPADAKAVAFFTKDGWRFVLAARGRADILLAAQASTAALTACMAKLAPHTPLETLLRLVT